MDNNSIDYEIRKAQEERRKMEIAGPEKKMENVEPLASVTFDPDLYNGNRFENYMRSIPVNEDEEDADGDTSVVPRRIASYTAPKSLLDIPRPSGSTTPVLRSHPESLTGRMNTAAGALTESFPQIVTTPLPLARPLLIPLFVHMRT
ncbi:hypothetical protein HPP92_019432 [Vanilla planifolia]|uniref:Uncharacterized protein n=1 Tax=Vanilla planifolia TaxID=51239 RepID=A0A835Q5S2_VANPL|nr:hypothetical protein HPP92_019432 [Vanilla planifolia]